MLAAMKNGKHAATEVPAAMTLDDCWAIVEAAEKHRKHCVMMENCNYDRMEMMVFNMVRQGLFGELLHAEGGYLHDLRGIKFENRNEGLWRRAWSMKLDGNLYPTHGLGPRRQLPRHQPRRSVRVPGLDEQPVARPAGLGARATFRPTRPQRQEKYVLGDVNTSLIKTARGRTIMVQHCTNLPRPYSRIHLVQGTKGLFSGLSEPRLHRRARQDRRSGSKRPRCSPSSSIRSGRRSRRRPRAPAMAGWTSSRTTG